MMSDMQIPIMLGSDKATQHLIAPVQDDLIAVQAYAVGEMFIFNNVLYKATSAISLGDAIVIGTNADVAGTITDAYGKYGGVVGVDADNPITGGRITTAGGSWTATEDCWLMGNTGMATSVATVYFPVCFPVKSGQQITTRSSGQVEINVDNKQFYKTFVSGSNPTLYYDLTAYKLKY